MTGCVLLAILLTHLCCRLANKRLWLCLCHRLLPCAYRPAPDAHVPDTIDLAGPAHISADAVSDPAAAAAAEEAAAAQRDSSGSQAVADESDEEEVALEEMQAALSKQHQADQLARQEAPVP